MPDIARGVRWRGSLYSKVKRLIDIAAAAALLTLLVLPMLFVALLVRRKLGAPVLFRQERPGLHGRPFMVLKFRTMSDARDRSGRLLSDGQRLGPFGRTLRRWSVDELPQFINVLRGDMSFIGPRPLLMEYLSLYDDTQRRRMEVRPGITGWAQVRGRNSATWQERFRDDVYYVDHLGPLIDAAIVGMTLRKVLSGDGVSATDHATVEPFRGNERAPTNAALACVSATRTSLDIPVRLCDAPGDSAQ